MTDTASASPSAKDVPAYDRASVADLMALADTYADTAVSTGIRSGWAQMARAAIEVALMKERAQPTPPAVVEPTELSPDFTDTARAALLWVLWHHQGGSSPVGQQIRFALGMGQNERLNEHQLREAKRWERLHPVNPSVLPSWPEPLAPVMTDVVGINARLHFRRGWRAAEVAHGIGIKKGEGNGN